MSTKKPKLYQEKIKIPEGATVELDGNLLKMKGKEGSIEKSFLSPQINLKKEGDFIILSTKQFSRNQKAVFNAFIAHIKNMLKGLSNPYIYKLKVCSSHFPVTVSVEGDTVLVKNFLGEKIPRKAKILPNTKVEAKGDIVTVTSIDKEAAGQTAANIEQSARVTKRDRRVFQDGVYIFIKAGESLL